MKKIEPNYRYFMEAMANRTPERMPLYEHNIDPGFISKAIGQPMEEIFATDPKKYFALTVSFWEDCGYDTVSFELGIPPSCPGSGSLRLHTPPPLSTGEEIENYPWDKIPDLYFADNERSFTLFAEEMRRHGELRALGGPGYGIFETVQDLVSYPGLCYLLADEPEAVESLFSHVSDLYAAIWSRFLRDYAEPFCVCRMGDDLGYDSQTLIRPDDIRRLILPAYKRVIDLAHASGRPFILHSCGKIFDIMEDVIALGIDAKHSNEDKIAPFSVWVERYGDRICNLGGIDMNVLCLDPPDVIREKTLACIRSSVGRGGFALGCGNSIPHYVPVEGYFAMLNTANEYRGTCSFS